jgi:hypothetical protein
VQFVPYLRDMELVLRRVWDRASGGFGSARWDFPLPKVSIFIGLSCHQKGYAFGMVVES